MEKTNKQLNKIRIELIDGKSAKKVILRNHYMKTYPQGAAVNFGVFYEGKLLGVCVMGYSSYTAKKIANIYPEPLQKNEYIELQRLWIDDELGNNTESYCLSKMVSIYKHKSKVKIILTHAGGCKNDCGILYQASNWLYFGKKECHDFFLTKDHSYKNIVNAVRFGRIKTKGKTNQQIGEELYGEGKIIDSYRYYYVYPIDKKIRDYLVKKSSLYPKDSAVFRKNQEWQKNK